LVHKPGLSKPQRAAGMKNQQWLPLRSGKFDQN
jgi:hypothetical protein